MKKILSCILAAAMVVGMLTVGAVAEDSGNTVLKFDDIPKEDGGGNVGMATYSDNEYINSNGFTVAMDFTYGRSCPCYHPTDATAHHSSKFAFTLGDSEGNFKYVGYSADLDVFFLATCVSAPMYGEGADGLEYLAVSETGLIQPGETNNVVYEFIGDTGVKIYVNGAEVLSFDLYDELDYPTYFAHRYIMMFPTHITCGIDNFAVYTPGTYDPVTGEGVDDHVYFASFEAEDGAMMKEKVEEPEVDEDGNIIEPETPVEPSEPTYYASVPDWQIVHDAYTLVNVDNDVYFQPNYVPAEGQANIVFQSGLNKKLEGHEDEIFASGKDFNIDLTIKNNAGLDSLTLDLVQDPFITVNSVTAADGLTATLGETDENGVTKLTITGSNYTGEALATITYTLSADAVQDHFYRYGAKVDTMKISGNEATENAVITGGMSDVYNYTVGDVNDDDLFNITDILLILKVVAKWDLPYFKEAGDVNGDGRTNSMDVSHYLRWLAMWKGYTVGGVTYY